MNTSAIIAAYKPYQNNKLICNPKRQVCKKTYEAGGLSLFQLTDIIKKGHL
jgi:hypothetical protein